MDVIDIAKRSLSTAWNNKKLWLFGLFVASSSSSGGSDGGQGAAPLTSAEAIPGWLWPLAGLALLLALAALIMHVISEAALIEGVDRSRRQGDGSFDLRDGFGVGLRHFWPVAGLKALLVGLSGISLALVAAPVALGALEVIPLWLGVGLTVVLALPAVPWLLTLYFLAQYALRLIVLERCDLGEAIRGAQDHLHGRIAQSLALLGVSLLGVVAAAAVMLVALIPVGLIAGVLYLLGGQLAALIGGALLIAPIALAVVGLLGTYRSGVWTHGFLSATGAAA